MATTGMAETTAETTAATTGMAEATVTLAATVTMVTTGIQVEPLHTAMVEA
jgi:hypothetical protein